MVVLRVVEGAFRALRAQGFRGLGCFVMCFKDLGSLFGELEGF